MSQLRFKVALTSAIVVGDGLVHLIFTRVIEIGYTGVRNKAITGGAVRVATLEVVMLRGIESHIHEK
jgi:hypothetical protein